MSTSIKVSTEAHPLSPTFQVWAMDDGTVEVWAQGERLCVLDTRAGEAWLPRALERAIITAKERDHGGERPDVVERAWEVTR